MITSIYSGLRNYWGRSSLIFSLCFFAWQNAFAEEIWTNSRPMLDTPQATLAHTEFPWLQASLKLFTKSLTNAEQQRQVVGIQTRLGTSVQTDSRKFQDRIVTEKSADPKATVEVARAIRGSIERDLKTATLPQAWQKGLSFEFGQKGPGILGKSAENTKLRYGLILTGIEPNSTPFRLASLVSGEEYHLVAYAPKASLHYKVGPIDYLPDQSIQPTLTSYEENLSWNSQLPELHFKAKIVPRGPITSGQYIPPQTLTFEQSQGFYTFEMQTSKLLHKEAIYHRFRLPLAKGMNFKQERNQNFLSQRNTLENIYAGHGFALNLDQFILEKRYQSTLTYRKNLTTIELYSHLPTRISENSHLWKEQRWELKLQRAF